ncbi:hypothetical protein CORT_0G01890 [Candida orthopsilosis Co 90-125]|uniref:MICOS complex subunit MIC12 n=1 Tax=Candida orthopsilosis (strain 90-125) TaxID=1136231 RepID=H8XAM2_CANO9|nr:hypothetical protein CORT_0G01890 [Candida orthopsilosis Co 90-125]CCG24872.1 hypothetical protein CORT_0G01890 [Candida orthopsilosis Co 90-125]
MQKCIKNVASYLCVYLSRTNKSNEQKKISKEYTVEHIQTQYTHTSSTMGGRIHGFLGGVLLTSALTYYTGQMFHRNQQFISQHLQQSNNIINNRILTDSEYRNTAIPDNHIVIEERPDFVETCKDIWNEEIIKMVNWIYGINWYKLGIKLDNEANKLTDKIAESLVNKK